MESLVEPKLFLTSVHRGTGIIQAFFIVLVICGSPAKCITRCWSDATITIGTIHMFHTAASWRIFYIYNTSATHVSALMSAFCTTKDSLSPFLFFSLHTNLLYIRYIWHEQHVIINDSIIFVVIDSSAREAIQFKDTRQPFECHSSLACMR